MKRFTTATALLMAAGAASPAAHHALEAIYATRTLVPLTGVITRVQVANPHVTVSLDVKDPAGGVTTWTVELAPPAALQRRAFDTQLLRPGQQVTFESWPRMDGAPGAAGRTLVGADGSRVDVGDQITWGSVPARR